MQLTDQQRQSILDVDTLLTRLAGEVVIGPAAGRPDAVRAAYAVVAGHVRALAVPELIALAVLVERAPAIAADQLAAFHRSVCDQWTRWGSSVGLVAGPCRLTLAADADASGDFWPAPTLSSPPPTVPPSRLHLAPPEPLPVEAAPRAAVEEPPASDDQDLVVLASDAEMAAMFVAEALDHLGTIEATILQLEAAPQDKRLLDDVFRPFHTIKGNAGALGVVSVQEFAHKVENLLDLARAGSASHGRRRNSTIVLESVDVLTTMIGELPARDRRAARTPTRARVSRPARWPGSIADSPAGELGGCASVADDAPTLDADGRRRRRSSRAGGAAQRRRRPAVGQGRHAQARQPRRHGRRAGHRAVADLRGSGARSASSTSACSATWRRCGASPPTCSATRCRCGMVPISQTFQKMARLVRDLSKKSGKAVELVLAGEDTELDRKVVEDINDPLMHMVRNCDRPRHRAGRGARPRRQARRGPPVAERLAPGRQHRHRDRATTAAGSTPRRSWPKAIERGLVAAGRARCRRATSIS